MDVRLPKLGEQAEGGSVVTILVKPGDLVAAGQTILELEQEKAVVAIPSTAAGTVEKVLVKEGDKIAVGAVLLTLAGQAGAPAPSPAGAPAAAAAPAKPARPQPRVIEDDDDEPLELTDDASDGAEPSASPYVRKVARDLGLRLSKVAGSGRGGRVTVEDLGRYIARLERAVARAGRHAEEPKGLVYPLVDEDFSLFGPVVSEPLSQMRQVIARRMVENKITLAHVTQFDEADMTRVEALRQTHASAFQAAGAKLTPTLFILKALVTTLKAHPRFNSSLNEAAGVLVTKQYYNIGIAVDTEAGLLVPVIRDADRKSMRELAVELTSLAVRARDRKLGLDDMKGGSFTISNQGAIGGGHFTPVINKPEAAILGVGRTRPKPVATAAGGVEVRPLTPLTVSYDHRIIDGGSAARFMVDLVKAIEQFPDEGVTL